MVIKYILKDCYEFYKLKKNYFKFISLIIFIGIILFLGLSSCYTDINKMVENNFKKTNGFDLKITSDVGFNYIDGEILRQIKEIKGIRLVKTQISESLINNNYYKLNISSISKNKNIKNEDYINRLTISNGKYPTTINEGLIDEDFANKNNIYIGDLITLTDQNSDNFKAKKIMIVGFTKTLNTSKDKIDANLYIEEKNFITSYYKEIYITLKDNTNIVKCKEDILNILSPIENDNKEKAKATLKLNINSLENSLQNFYSLSTPENKLNNAIKTYSQSLDYRKKELENISNSKLIITSKDEITSSNNFELILNKSKALSILFPTLFLGITLIILAFCIYTLMKKEENKIKTLYIYGFNNISIMSKYLLLHFIVCIKAIFFGVLFHKIIIIIPWLTNNYLKQISLHFSPFNLKSIILPTITITLTIFIYVIVNYYLIINKKCNYFKRKKTTLYLIKKKFNKLNNYIENLNIKNKLIIKNILGNTKKSVISTIYITLCLTLLLTGFGIINTIKNTVNKELNTLYKFDITAKLSDNYSSEEKILLQSKINDLNYVKNSIKLYETKIVLKNKYNITLIVPDDLKSLNKFIEIKNKNKNVITITKNIAKKANIKKNDKITITINNNKYKVKVINIVNDYFNDSIYMSNSLYKKLTKEKVNYNNLLITLKNKKNIEDKKKEIYLIPEIKEINLKENLSYKYNNSTISLYFLSSLLITSSLILIIILLITMIKNKDTNKQINYLKTNGFYTNEITMILIKEKLILFIISILLSIILSFLTTLCIFILSNICFSFKINITSFLILIIISIIFILITTLLSLLNDKICK